MSTILCISEIEEPILFQSSLTVSLKQQYNMYCVLVKDYFILFKKPSDIISFKRLPITNKTNIEMENSKTGLTIIIASNKYTFISTDIELIGKLFNEITGLIKNYTSPEPLVGYEYSEVEIDQIGNSNVYILMGNEDYNLFIYENLDEHKNNIVSHIINCKFYSLENDSQITSNSIRSIGRSLRLLGKNQAFKITFKEDAIVIKWKCLFLIATSSSFNDGNFKILKDIYDNESNRFCADCGSPNPEWISIDFFVIVCINCAGIHRSLGKSYSRIQNAINNEKCWEHKSNLLEILKEIGNEKSNSFWYRNKPKINSILNDYSVFIKDKYVMKKFIDKEFIGQSNEELIGKLKLFVATNDLFSTIRLWNSIDFDYQPDFVEELLEISRNSNQTLQQEFLLLQPTNKSISNEHKSIVISENVLQIAYNDNSEKLNDLFLVSLQNNCISIKIENCSVTPIELINVCCIYFDNIDLVWYDYFNNETLLISVNPSIVFHKIIGRLSLNNYQQIDVNRFSFFSQSKSILKNLKFELLKLLLISNNNINNNNYNININDESILFMNIDVRKNGERFTKCKCFITDHEIIFSSPFSLLYDLKKSEKCVLIDDRKSVLLKFKVDELELITTNVENQKIIYSCLEKGNKSIELLKDPIDKMIFFISSRGLRSEGIFRISGTIKKVDALYKSIEKSSEPFTIDPNIYNVNDVASCLKKYFRSLNEPIITIDLFDKFREASIEENLTEKLTLYKKALSRFSRDNYSVFRKLLELFFMIQMPINDNRMDSSSLAISVSSSFISFDNSNIQINSNIMRDLIENFVILFDYSKTELEILKKFIEGPSNNNIDQNIIRNFYVHPKLTDNLKMKNIDHGKLNFLDREISYIIVNINLNKCVVVKQVYELFFKDYEMQLWHFLTKRSGFSLKTIKRLIYLNDGIVHSILYPRTIVNYDSYFVFLMKPPLQNTTSSTNAVRRLFQCEVKLKSTEKYQDFTLIMSFPNSLQFFDIKSKSLDPIYNFLLSDIIVYRFHTRTIGKIFLLYATNGFIRVKFDNFDVLKEFLYFYDQFRN